MTRLVPELRRLVNWAKVAPEGPPPVIAPGFAGRVVARWCSTVVTDPFVIWQKALWASGWAAAAVIGLGLVLLSSQKLANDSAYDFSPAYQAVSLELVP